MRSNILLVLELMKKTWGVWHRYPEESLDALIVIGDREMSGKVDTYHIIFQLEIRCQHLLRLRPNKVYADIENDMVVGFVRKT